MKKISKKQGILFWVTGLAGSGKTTYAKLLKKKITKRYGPTIVISGDELRKSFDLKGYTYSERKIIVNKYIKLLKIIIKQKINVIFAVIGMMNVIRENNKKLFKNYIEIFIKAKLVKLKKKNKKNLYKGKKKNVVGRDIKPEFPKKPDVIFYNKFNSNIKKNEEIIFNKIQKVIRQ